MFCYQCGQQIKDKDEFCQNCGASSDGAVTKTSEEITRTTRLTGWRRIKYILASIVLLALSITWIYDLTAESGSGDAWGLMMAVVFGLWGSALLARVFGRTLSGIVKDFFRSKSVKTTSGIIKKLLKFALWIGLIAFVVWLIIALGPLWIIAIILLLIFFVLANK